MKDLIRVMSRLKAVYRSWAIPCAGRDVYYSRHRAEWLGKIKEVGVRRRAEQLYLHLDMLQRSRQQARRELLAESRKHAITAKFRQIPCVGPIRSALLVALLQTPNRFRTERQLWAYSGLAVRDSYQRGPSLCRRLITTLQETNLHSRTEQGPQPRPKRFVQSCGHDGQCASRTVPGLLSEITSQRYQFKPSFPELELYQRTTAKVSNFAQIRHSLSD